MRIRFELPRWLAQVAVAVAYCVAFQLLHDLSISHWNLPSGLRLGCVLLMPRRYWVALLIGDVAAAAPLSYQCLDQLGLAWSLLHLFPQIVFAMLPAWLLREYLPGPLAGKRERPITLGRMAMVLGCALALVVPSAVDGVIQVSLMTHPEGHTPPLSEVAVIFFMGQYLGCLVLVPIALMAYEGARTRATSLRRLLRQLAKSPVILEAVVIGLVSFGLLAILMQGNSNGTLHQTARLGAFLPVAWLALRHGWRGAALGGVIASGGVMIIMPASLYDPSTLQAQSYLAMVISAILVLGAQSDGLLRRERQMARNYRRAQQVARREVYAAELRMRRMSEVLERSHGLLQLSHGRLLHRMRFVLSGTETSIYREELQTIRQQIYRVVDSITPRDWSRRDLSGALWNGPITQALEDIGVAYYVKDPRGSLGELPSDVRLSLFRLACEAVAYLLAEGPIAAISLHLRGGRNRAGRSWAVLVVEGERDVELVSMLGISPPTGEQIHEWLGASGLDLRGMRDRASLYDGLVHARRNIGGGRVSFMLQNAPETQPASAS